MADIFERAIDVIEYNYGSNWSIYEYSPLYMFSTENINGIMRCMDVSAKNILTVSSSGDHVFNMLLGGAYDVECYDINYFAKYYFYFKEAAIRGLSYNEFLEFFLSRNSVLNGKYFNDKVFFDKICPNIRDIEAREFWFNLFKIYGGRGLSNSYLFFNNSYSNKTYIHCNGYLGSEDNYIFLQRCLRDYEYKFYWANIFGDISNLPDKEYDIIYFSNILDRLVCKDELSYIRKIKEIEDVFVKYLSVNGVLGMCYLYCYLDEYWKVLTPNHITSPDIRYQYFRDASYVYREFNGIMNPSSSFYKNRDALMLKLKK